MAQSVVSELWSVSLLISFQDNRPVPVGESDRPHVHTHLRDPLRGRDKGNLEAGDGTTALCSRTSGSSVGEPALPKPGQGPAFGGSALLQHWRHSAVLPPKRAARMWEGGIVFGGPGLLFGSRRGWFSSRLRQHEFFDFTGAAPGLCLRTESRSPGVALSSATLQWSLFTKVLARPQIPSPLPALPPNQLPFSLSFGSRWKTDWPFWVVTDTWTVQNPFYSPSAALFCLGAWLPGAAQMGGLQQLSLLPFRSCFAFTIWHPWHWVNKCFVTESPQCSLTIMMASRKMCLWRVLGPRLPLGWIHLSKTEFQTRIWKLLAQWLPPSWQGVSTWKGHKASLFHLGTKHSAECWYEKLVLGHTRS